MPKIQLQGSMRIHIIGLTRNEKVWLMSNELSMKGYIWKTINLTNRVKKK